jgi:hypothetical protein
MLDALREIDQLTEEYRRLSSYAGMKSDLDKANASDLARSQEMEQVGARFSAAISFLAPEVLALPEGTVERFLKTEPALARYAHDLRDIERRRPHTLSPEEEKLLADAGTISGSAQNLYEVLATADLPFPDVTLSSGEKVRIDQASYVRHRTAAKREDRLAVFNAFFTAWRGYERTLGVALDAEVRKNIFYSRSRRYGSALEASLDRNHVPARVYDAMLEVANESLPTLHRYLKLRARMLGVKDLGYHDIYAPLVPQSARSYSIDEARKLVLDAVAPLGPDYVATLGRGYENRWVDVWPSRGKRSGAYSNGLRLRRASVHPDELHGQLRRRHHARARERPCDAQLARQPRAAVHHRRLSDLRGGGRLDVQRSAPLSARDRACEGREREARAPVRLARWRAGHVLPPGDVRGVRALDRPRGGSRPVPHGRGPGQDVPRPHPEVPRLGAGRLRGGRPLRGGVGLHPALLRELLRLPVRDRLRGLDRAGARRARRRSRGARTATSTSSRPAARTIPTSSSRRQASI